VAVDKKSKCGWLEGLWTPHSWPGTSEEKLLPGRSEWEWEVRWRWKDWSEGPPKDVWWTNKVVVGKDFGLSSTILESSSHGMMRHGWRRWMRDKVMFCRGIICCSSCNGGVGSTVRVALGEGKTDGFGSISKDDWKWEQVVVGLGSWGEVSSWKLVAVLMSIEVSFVEVCVGLAIFTRPAKMTRTRHE
jgi:hypothetical protein